MEVSKRKQTKNAASFSLYSDNAKLYIECEEVETKQKPNTQKRGRRTFLVLKE